MGNKMEKEVLFIENHFSVKTEDSRREVLLSPPVSFAHGPTDWWEPAGCQALSQA